MTEPSSNLGRMGSTVTNALLAKWSRQPPSKREIPGSNPGWGIWDNIVYRYYATVFNGRETRFESLLLYP